MKCNLIAAVAMTAALTLPAQANNIVEEWASIKAPAAPTLKPVTVDSKTTAPGEMRGPSIRGGTEAKLSAGDVLHIPAKVAHQMILAPGAQVTYFVTKVVE